LRQIFNEVNVSLRGGRSRDVLQVIAMTMSRLLPQQLSPCLRLLSTQYHVTHDWNNEHPSPLTLLVGHRTSGQPGETDNRATTPFGHCLSTAFLPVRPHCANARRNRCQEDVNTAVFLRNWKRPADCPRISGWRLSSKTWNQKPILERSNRRGSELSTLETDIYVWRYALLVVHAIKEEDNTQLFTCKKHSSSTLSCNHVLMSHLHYSLQWMQSI